MKNALTSLSERDKCMHVDIQAVDKMHISNDEIILDTLKKNYCANTAGLRKCKNGEWNKLVNILGI